MIMKKTDSETVDLSIVIPVNNEAKNIPSLTAAIAKVFSNQKISFEVIFVDDGSTDETPRILEESMRRFPEVRAIVHEVRCGQSSAILSGVRAARSGIIATMDGDLQNDPKDIPRMLHLLQSEKDGEVAMVSGIREKREDAFWRTFSSRAANAIRKTILQDQSSDTGCGLKLFYRESFLSLPYFSTMHRFLPALVKRQNKTVCFVNVSHHQRHRGRSHYGTMKRLWEGIVDILGVLWLQKRGDTPTGLHELGGEKSEKVSDITVSDDPSSSTMKRADGKINGRRNQDRFPNGDTLRWDAFGETHCG